jgi:DNA-binding beta-propeller fold protein YncE
MGRKGAGPAEFANPIGMTLDRSGRLWVADPGNGRYAVFDTAGKFVRTVQRPIAGWGIPWRGAFDREGNLVEGTSGRSRSGAREEMFVRMKLGSDLTPVDTLRFAGVEDQYLEFKGDDGQHSMVGLPFATGQIINFEGRGFVWSGVSDRYRIVQMNLRGDTVRVFQRPFTRPPVTRAERTEALDRLKPFTKNPAQYAARVPSTKPAWVTYVVAPDGGLWVFPSTTTAGSAVDRFDPNGRWIQTATSNQKISRLPAVPIVRNGRLYGVVRDADDVQFVVRIRSEPLK